MDNYMDNNMNNDVNNNMNDNMNNDMNNNQSNNKKSLLEKFSYDLIYVRAVCIVMFFLEPFLYDLIPIDNLNIIILMLVHYTYPIAVIVNFTILIIAKVKKLFDIKIQLSASLLMFSILLVMVFSIGNTTSYKPIIYLYPEEETEVSVKLDNKDDITCSYPKYIDGWNVIAKPNGDLTYVQDGKELYSLYYESKNEKNYKVEDDGFVVKGEDTAEFLEEKLEILGLNYKEKEEFIVYWLPKLEANKYNYIRFATMDEINQNMKLEFSKKPDTLIRVMMTYKGLERPIEVKEQKLETPERKGFVAVEWGGSEIK